MSIPRPADGILSKAVALLTGMLLLYASTAKASTYNFSFFDAGTGGALVNASGSLETTSLGAYDQITQISGTYNGSPITGLIAPNGFQDNDNLLYFRIALIDIYGFSFNAGGQSINVYYDSVGYFICPGCYGNYNGADTVINLSITPTPLPTALPLFAGGLGAITLIGWRRKRKKAASSVLATSVGCS